MISVAASPPVVSPSSGEQRDRCEWCGGTAGVRIFRNDWSMEARQPLCIPCLRAAKAPEAWWLGLRVVS